MNRWSATARGKTWVPSREIHEGRRGAREREEKTGVVCVVLWGRGRGLTYAEDTEDLVAGDALDEGDAVGVTENDTDLRGGHTLLGELGDHVEDLEARGGGI